jgi:hypothetical protein
MFVFKFLFYFSISFALLSIRIDNNSIFDHIDSQTRPYTIKAFGIIQEKTDSFLGSTAAVGKKLFQNTTPEKVDNVKRSLSANKKLEAKKELELKKELEEDHFTDEEKEILKNIIEKAQY